MRILMLSQWFDPEPSFKGIVFAKALMEQGHTVEVLTGFPNYPGGKLYPGYKVKMLQRETMDGISVIRVPLYPSHDGSSFKRAMNYTSFALAAGVLGPLLVKPADVMYVYHPPATIALPAIMLKLFRRIPFVYDIQDLWPDTLKATGMLNNRFIIRFISAWCLLAYRLADRIVVLSPGFKEKLQERGVPEKKISVIYNWCDEIQMAAMDRGEAEKQEPLMTGRFNVVFAGTMGRAQALDTVIEAAVLVAKRMPNVQFVFIGGGVDGGRLKKAAEERHLQNVLFLPRRPVTEMGSVLSMADVLLVHLKNDPLFEITIPSKTQAYLAAGRPILMAMKGNAADLVERSGAGLSCAPEDPQGLAKAVESLAKMPKRQLDEMGLKGKQYYEHELSLQVGVRRFEDMFRITAGTS